MPGWQQNYDEISADRQCTVWLKKASVRCQVATEAAKRCEVRSLSLARLASTTMNAGCRKAREECANTLEWCRVEPGSMGCLHANEPCSRIKSECKHPVHMDALSKCLPVQKARTHTCGEGYAKAYSACWYAFDAISKNSTDTSSEDLQALEADVAVHRCGKAFADSKILCRHRRDFFDAVASHHPDQAQVLVQRRDAACDTVHQGRQHQCRAAWAQISAREQAREEQARAHGHAAHTTPLESPVFWPHWQPHLSPAAPAPVSDPMAMEAPSQGMQPLAQDPFVSEQPLGGVEAFENEPWAAAGGRASTRAAQDPFDQPTQVDPLGAEQPPITRASMQGGAMWSKMLQESHDIRKLVAGDVQQPAEPGEELVEVEETSSSKATAKEESKATANDKAEAKVKADAKEKTESKEKATAGNKETINPESSTNNPYSPLKPSRVHPSLFNTSRDTPADGQFSDLESEKAAQAAEAKAANLEEAKHRAAVVKAAQQFTPVVDPALKGKDAYHTEHPLTVAMQTCQAQQHSAAVHCLDTSETACHSTWEQAYISCFNIFAQAKNWLVRDKRLPAEHPVLATPPSRKDEVLPPELQRTAQLACARSYAQFSSKCNDAHQKTGALCRAYATRSGAGITDAAEQSCGSAHQQADAMCEQARAVGKARCEASWESANAMVRASAAQHHKTATASAAEITKSGMVVGGQPALSRGSVEEQLQEAQMTTMAHLEAAKARLQGIRNSGMVTGGSEGEEEEALLDMFALHGLHSSLAGTMSGLGWDSSDLLILIQQPTSEQAAAPGQEQVQGSGEH